MHDRSYTVARIVASGFGVGLVGWAPGTIGSLWGLPIGWCVHHRLAGWAALAASAAAWLVLMVVGVWSSRRVAAAEGEKDPQHVVIDEIAAFPLVYLPLCFVGGGWSWGVGWVGFGLFRFFDILKPWPIRRLERLPGGWGIMIDDQLAGLYAAGALWVTLWSGLM